MKISPPTAALDAIALLLRIARTRSAAARVAPLPARGVCHSCGRRSVFLTTDNALLVTRMKDWPYEEAVLDALATRENHACLWCGRNFRMRQLAGVAWTALHGAVVYEPATFGVFSRRRRRDARVYIDSEYLDGAAPGTVVGGRRHEDIRQLTFSDAAFDVVITSELFEHVDDPWRGFAEVRRVLQDGGRHFFTVPHVPGQRTRSRIGRQSVYHVDPLRLEGISVNTDFGDDLPDILRRYGFHTRVHEFPSSRPILRVYESQAL